MVVHPGDMSFPAKLCFEKHGFDVIHFVLASDVIMHTKTENYRPMSLISVLCKLLETFIKDHMVDCIVQNKLITKSQHGFLNAMSLMFFRIYY